MPISPENMVRYPGGSIKSPEWQAIRSFIRARAGGCCEECGVRNLTHWQKLSIDDIPTIRARISAGESNVSIAADYGVGDRAISKIRLGQRWAHVP